MQTKRKLTQGKLNQLFHYHSGHNKVQQSNVLRSKKSLPKGFNRATLKKVVHYLQSVEGASA
ncbi:response regulator, partial [Lysinibacillus agricola]